MGARDAIVKALMGAIGGPNKLGRGGIDVYHSSPHDSTSSTLSKIGTGEGAQAYGHGLYFAENPAVSGQGGQYWKQFITFRRTPEGCSGNVLTVRSLIARRCISQKCEAQMIDAREGSQSAR